MDTRQDETAINRQSQLALNDAKESAKGERVERIELVEKRVKPAAPSQTHCDTPEDFELLLKVAASIFLNRKQTG